MPWADHIPTLEETREHLTGARERFHKGEDCGLFIWDRVTGAFVGATGLHPRLADVRRREIGYWIRSSAAGRGYATEAVRAVARCALEQLDLAAVEIHVSQRNVASQKVAEAVGFTRIKVMAGDRIDPDGSPSSTWVYELVGEAPRVI